MKHIVLAVLLTWPFLALQSQINFDEAISGDLNYLYQDTFVVSVGSNVWTGVIEPTPGSQQDTWMMIVPPGMEVTSVTYTRGPVGSETITFLFNSCITGIPWTTDDTLHYVFDPPAGSWFYCMQILTDWLVNPTPWTVTVAVSGADPCASNGGDTDGDTVCDDADGCPDDPNKTEPGACGCGFAETDSDGDAVPDCVDQCEGSDDAMDADADGIPDGCDLCAADPFNDVDGDGLCGDVDNCPDDANADQSDIDLDGIGDICDDILDVESVGDNIETMLDTLDLPGNVEQSMNVKIDNALAHYCQNGNANAAINQLNAFINQVNSKRGNPLTDAEADQLIYMAQQMILAIQNGTVECGANSPFMLNPEAVDPKTVNPVEALINPDRNGQAGAVDLDVNLPTLAAHPIPAIREVTFHLAFTGDEVVTIEIFNEAGNKVDQLLVNQLLPAGQHAILWNAGDASGIFTVRMQTATAIAVSRVVIVQR